MTSDAPAYGLWVMVAINSAVFLLFAFSFFKPKSIRDWRSFGTFSAFLVALFAEMYGFPLTIYLLSGWLQKLAPGVDFLSHESGHLWFSLLGSEGDPHFHPVHIASYLLIFGGFTLLATAWPVLYTAQKEKRLAVSGPYRLIRHPQYVGFVLIMFGFLLMWPTLLTLAMFPLLVFMYVRLSIREEREALELFGESWNEYSAKTPRYLPRWNMEKIKK